MKALQALGGWFNLRRARIQARLPWPAAHDENSAFLILIGASLALVLMVDAAIERHNQPLTSWLAATLLWLPLVPGDLCLPSAKANGLLRAGYLMAELALVLGFGWIEGFQVATYVLFAIVGQAGFILRVPQAFLFLVLTACARIAALHLHGRDADTPITADVSWIIGAAFVVLAVAAMKRAIDQRGQIMRLVTGLEAAKLLATAQSVELERQALEDKLTGLHNRRFLDMELPREFERARRFGHALTLAMIDMDDFKEINDNHSHQVGDEVLAELGNILRRACRSIDGVVRYGGDEFLLYFPETSLETGTLACNRVRQLVEEADWARFAPGIKPSLSIGLAELGSEISPDQLIAAADARLLEAKRRGKNQLISAG